MNLQKPMFQKKRCNHAALMPYGIVNPQVYGFVFKAIHNPSQHLQKTIGITLNPSHDTMCPLYWINPAKYVQPLLMLASGIHIRLHTPFSPYSAKLRVQRKTGFILKNNYVPALTVPGRAEFFLLSLQTAQLPACLPAQNDIWAVLVNSQDTLPAAVHAVHESGYDAAALSTALSRPHPSGSGIARTFEAIPVTPDQDHAKSPHQTATDVQAGRGLLWHPIPLCWPCVSISLLTNGIIRIVQLFALISSPTITAIMLLCVSRPIHAPGISSACSKRASLLMSLWVMLS